MRTVAQELRAKQNLGLYDLYTGRRKLSFDAREVVRGAAFELTGYISMNDYWRPMIMSEAIEAAEALRL